MGANFEENIDVFRLIFFSAALLWRQVVSDFLTYKMFQYYISEHYISFKRDSVAMKGEKGQGD
jgi:hypothetical protein